MTTFTSCSIRSMNRYGNSTITDFNKNITIKIEINVGELDRIVNDLKCKYTITTTLSYSIALNVFFEVSAFNYSSPARSRLK